MESSEKVAVLDEEVMEKEKEGEVTVNLIVKETTTVQVFEF